MPIGDDAAKNVTSINTQRSAPACKEHTRWGVNLRYQKTLTVGGDSIRVVLPSGVETVEVSGLEQNLWIVPLNRRPADANVRHHQISDGDQTHEIQLFASGSPSGKYAPVDRHLYFCALRKGLNVDLAPACFV